MPNWRADTVRCLRDADAREGAKRALAKNSGYGQGRTMLSGDQNVFPLQGLPWRPI